jgi:putative membrane protein
MRTAARLAVLAAALACPALLSSRTWQAAPGASEQDRTFLVAAHQSNLAGIAAGRAAEQKGSSAGVRGLGARLAADHRALDASLQKVAGQLSVSLPPTPDAAQQRQLAAVSARSGAAFDRAWIASRIADHRQTTAAGQTELSAGTNSQVKGLARAAAPVVRTHLDMLRRLGGHDGTGVSADGALAAAGPAWWRSRAAWVLTAVGLVLVAFAALVPGRAQARLPLLRTRVRPQG